MGILDVISMSTILTRNDGIISIQDFFLTPPWIERNSQAPKKKILPATPRKKSEIYMRWWNWVNFLRKVTFFFCMHLAIINRKCILCVKWVSGAAAATYKPPLSMLLNSSNYQPSASHCSRTFNIIISSIYAHSSYFLINKKLTIFN